MEQDNIKFNKISFLTDDENEVMYHLVAATAMFEKLCEKDPQNPSDSYNFGHYVDAAKNAVIMRGARRMDPENLIMTTKSTMDTTHRNLVKRGEKAWNDVFSKMFGEDPISECTGQDETQPGGEVVESEEGNRE